MLKLNIYKTNMRIKELHNVIMTCLVQGQIAKNMNMSDLFLKF